MARLRGRGGVPSSRLKWASAKDCRRQRAASELAPRSALLERIACSRRREARSRGFDRSAEFRPLDRHEIEQLAGPARPELRREHAGACARASTASNRMIGRQGMPLEKPVAVTLDGDDRRRVERFSPGDQHIVAMRQRRHNARKYMAPSLNQNGAGLCGGSRPWGFDAGPSGECVRLTRRRGVKPPELGGGVGGLAWASVGDIDWTSRPWQ